MGWVIKFCNKHSSAAMAAHFGNAETDGGESVLNSLETLNFEPATAMAVTRATPQVDFSFDLSIDRARASSRWKRVEGLAVSLRGMTSRSAWRWISFRNCFN